MNSDSEPRRPAPDMLESILNACCDVSTLLAGRAQLGEALQVVVRRLCEVLAAEACSIGLWLPQSKEFRLAAQYGLSETHEASARLLPNPTPLEAEALAGKIVPVADIQTDPRTRDPAPFEQAGLHAALFVPIQHRGTVLGILKMYRQSSRPMNGLELMVLRAVAAQVAAAVAFERMTASWRELAGVERQLQLAGQVQRRMVPSRPPVIPGFDLACAYEPSLQMGGDFYDFIPVPGGNLGVVMADVCGKGAPAALLMAAVRSAFRVHTQNIFEIRQIMGQINRQLVADTLPGEFATVWYGVLDPAGMMLTYVNAGHEYPLLLRGGEIRTLEKGGLVVGVDAEAAYEQEAVALAPQDVILLYTDGASEALSYSGEPFGRTRLQEALKKYASLSAGDILRNIRMDLWRFIGLKPQSDDVSLVCVKVGAREALATSQGI